jgi:2,4-dienoyl-CoA reductase-like NADH-dependent reductase (Old Yellow Enzyme family)
MEQALQDGFEFIGMARPLINDPAFVNKMKKAEEEGNGDVRSGCKHANYCIGRMYSLDMVCHQHVKNIPKRLLDEFK